MKMLISSALVCFSTLAWAACDIDNPFVGCFEYDPKQVKSIPKITVEPVKQAPINTSKVTEARHDSCPADRRIYVGNAGQFLCRHEGAELKRSASDVAAMYANGGDGARTLGLVEAGLREGASSDYVVTTESRVTTSFDYVNSSYLKLNTKEKNDVANNLLYVINKYGYKSKLVGEKVAACEGIMAVLLKSKVKLNDLKNEDTANFGLGYIFLFSGDKAMMDQATSLAKKSVDPIEMAKFNANKDDLNTANRIVTSIQASNEAFAQMQFLEDLKACSMALQNSSDTRVKQVNK